MPYDVSVLDRLRAALARCLAPTDDLEEKKMFGGIAELINGHMCVGLLNTDLIIHVRETDIPTIASRPHVRPMDFTGRPMKGWYYVAADGYESNTDLDYWVKAGLAYAYESGPKQAGSKSPKKSRSKKR
ncbi:MAG: TfoX/Sxy family protein [Polyangiaceae bacterium]|nr:TfoX/Sxy family protein [Polyangiaceae bacterium]